MNETKTDPDVLMNMVRELIPILRGKMSKDGSAWMTKQEFAEMGKRFGIDPKSMGAVSKRCKNSLGVAIEWRGRRGHQVQTLIDLLRESGGEITPEVRDLFQAEHPGAKITGPTVRAARTRLGMAPPPGRVPTLSDPKEYGDMLIAFREFTQLSSKREALIQKKRSMEHELDAQLSKLDGELEKYRPIVGLMASMKDALRSVKDGVGDRG